MKIVVILFYCVCFVVRSYAQEINEYDAIDKIAMNIPSQQTDNTSDIADYINKHFDTESKKVRAIYTWISNNIHYDKNFVHPVILKEDHEQKIITSLKNKKGVCENFAEIFNEVCLKCGLKSFVVEGYTKQNGSLDKSPHAWCTVFTDNKWYLYDPTWDEGFIKKNLSFSGMADYYQASPLFFLETHMPFDPMFQLLNYTVSYNEFSNGYKKPESTKAFFNYNDSISAYEKMNSFEQDSAAVMHLQNNGALSEKVINKIKQLQMEMEIAYGDTDGSLYNASIADYNEAIAIYNSFIAYRNNQFKPLKTDEEIQKIFKEIEKKIEKARSQLHLVSSSRATLVLDVSVIENKLTDLSSHIQEQQLFFKNYVSTTKGK